MSDTPFQDCYPDEYSHCYGCGRLNDKGHQIKSYWDGDEGVCRLLPANHYSGGMKTILYGGLIASLMDCHGAATAAAAKARELGIEMQAGALPRFVTASLKVDYRSPTPVGKEVELRARVEEIAGRKVRVSVRLSTDGTVHAEGELLMIQLKDS